MRTKYDPPVATSQSINDVARKLFRETGKIKGHGAKYATIYVHQILAAAKREGVDLDEILPASWFET